MIAEVINVGTELLLGNIVNTNAAYLAEKCAEYGFSLFHQSVVGDNEKRLEEALELAVSRSDIILLSGGLGPTEDDLTKEVAANFLDKKLVEDPIAKKNVTDFFDRIKAGEITKNNLKQALVIEGSAVLVNKNGTAPGLIAVSKENKHFVLLPGPPDELIPLFEESVIPYLEKLQTGILLSKTIKLCGIGESKAENEIADLIKNQSNPTIAPYAKTGEVHIRVTAKAESKEEAKQLLKPVIKELKNRFGNAVYSMEGNETFEECIVKQLSKKGLTLVTAESCTGGLFAGRIINVSGASQVYNQGFITYSNHSKTKYLGVSKDVLKKYGAVSKQTAKEMAKGAALETGSDVAVAITGLAGPEGGTPEKPVGLVYIACYYKGKTTVKECNFIGNRYKIRMNTVAMALTLLRECIS